MDAIRVPYALAVYGNEEISAVLEVLKDPSHIVPGVRVREFEDRIAPLFGKLYGVMVNSGSSANLLALELLSLPPGSEVITPILTFATTVAPILQKGLIPVFVDVEEGTYQINCDLIEEAITEKTRALLIPSLIGNIPDYKRLRSIADKYHLYLIEDSCDTLGSLMDGKPPGVLTDISTTSFYASHIITAAGGGGMICLNSQELLDRARVLRGWGRSSALFAESEDIAQRFNTTIEDMPYDGKFIFSEVGYNFQPIELQAAFGLEQLKRLDAFGEARKKNFKDLLEFFRPYQDLLLLPREYEGIETSWLAFPLIVRSDAPFTRIEIARYLEEHNIQTRPLFTGNILRQPGFREVPHRSPRAEHPVTEQVMKGSFMIGCHHGLTQVHVDYMKLIFSEFFKKVGR